MDTKTVNAIMDALASEVPGQEFAFSDDGAECGFEWKFGDLSKLWLNLSRDGKVSIYWRKGGDDYKDGRVLTLADNN